MSIDHVDGQIALTKDVPDIHLCRRCGRKLTDPKRIAIGIGYCCAKNEEDDGIKNDAVIAEWAGWLPPSNPDFIKTEGLMFHSGIDGGEWYDTKLDRDLGNGNRTPAAEVHSQIGWTSPAGSMTSNLPPFSTDANLWFGPDGLLSHAVKAFGSTWIIASLRMNWEMGPHHWADTLAKMIEEAG